MVLKDTVNNFFCDRKEGKKKADLKLDDNIQWIFSKRWDVSLLSTWTYGSLKTCILPFLKQIKNQPEWSERKKISPF